MDKKRFLQFRISESLVEGDDFDLIAMGRSEGPGCYCYANNVHLAYIYIRGEFVEGAKILNRALAEARARNFLGTNILGSSYDLEIYVHRGAGAYICGEETALIESLEGKRGEPRTRPPYPPSAG
jgi:NADH-quinone oxidoreductase subunit F